MNDLTIHTSPADQPTRAMPIYLCTLHEKTTAGFGSRPLEVDGHCVESEIVAENAGKARYCFWRKLLDAWGAEACRIIDIRVRSVRTTQPDPPDGWQARLDDANRIVRIMATHGRRFFSSDADHSQPSRNPFIAHFQMDHYNELWFVDSYTRKPVLVRHREWPGFHNGGTLRAIVEHLAKHINVATPINPVYFGPSPKWVRGGDLWGYGPAMRNVTADVTRILEKTH